MNTLRHITGHPHCCFILLMTCTWPVLGAERELDTGPAPGSALEIETPIQRVFPSAVERPSIFPELREQIQDLPAFFADTILEARFRTAYIKKDRAIGPISEALAMGGSIYYRSGWLDDLFAVETEAFTSQPVYAPDNRGGTGLLTPGQNGYSVLGIANAKLRYHGFLLTAGRQYLDLPYVNKSDSRMTPNTFESLTLIQTDGKLRISTGYTWKIKRQTSENFLSMTEAVGIDKKRGLAHLDVVWDPQNNFHVGVSSGIIPDLLTVIYSELGLGGEFTNGWQGRLDGQYTRLWENGDDLLGTLLDDTWNLGLRASASRANTVVRLGVSITGPNAGIISRYGTSPSYVDLMQRTFNLADEKALLASVSYDFSGHGLEELSMIMNLVSAVDGKLNGLSIDRQELDLTIDYRVKKGALKNFWLRLRSSWLDEDSIDKDSTDFRIILRYDIPFI